MGEFIEELRKKNMEKKVNENFNRMKEIRKVSPLELKKILAFHLGSVLHEDWKEEDRLEYENANEDEKKSNWELGSDGELRKFMAVDGKIKNKTYKDLLFDFKEDDLAYRSEERKVDVRALSFDELPFVLKKKYVEEGSWLMDLLYDKVMFNGEENIEKILLDSEEYGKLPEELKEKYKRHASQALSLLKKVEEREITLGKILEEEGFAYSKFNVQVSEMQRKADKVR